MFCSCFNIKGRQEPSGDEYFPYGAGRSPNSFTSKHEIIDRPASTSNNKTNNSMHNSMTQGSSCGIFNFLRHREKTRKKGSKEELRLQKTRLCSFGKVGKIRLKKNNTLSCRKTESVDDELDTDGYSKLDGDIHLRERYDYPTFLRGVNCPGGIDEHLYASASQTYSFWSEDPYSSIKSVIGDRAMGTRGDESSIYEPGYSKIRKIPIQRAKVTSAEDPKNSPLDLYSKIVHSNHRSKRDFRPEEHPSTSADNEPSNNLDSPQKFSIDDKSLLDNQQDSVSGSITSGSQPSYRYLTVRESPRIVRERIRRREEAAAALLLNENNENSDRSVGERRNEHYYSEINEYESVGGESLYNRSIFQPDNENMKVSSSAQHKQLANGVGTLEMLRLDFGLNGSVKPPHPPTSPVPKTLPLPSCSSSNDLPPQSSVVSKPSIRRPVVLRMPHKLLNTVSEEDPKKIHTSSRFSTNSDFSKHMRDVLQSIWTNGGSLISEKKQQKSEISNQSSLATSTRNSLVEVNTQTSPMPPSRIPIPLNGILKNNYITRRTPSPTRNAAVQTTECNGEQKNFKTGKKNVKKLLPPPLPAQVGKDYVSPIDLGNERSWPFKTLNQTEDGG